MWYFAFLSIFPLPPQMSSLWKDGAQHYVAAVGKGSNMQKMLKKAENVQELEDFYEEQGAAAQDKQE